jgi:hypothetical protein
MDVIILCNVRSFSSTSTTMPRMQASDSPIPSPQLELVHTEGWGDWNGGSTWPEPVSPLSSVARDDALLELWTEHLSTVGMNGPECELHFFIGF